MSIQAYQKLYSQTAFEASRVVTKYYSTSFYLSILLLGRSIRQPICNVYGMVRIADEVVDTFQHLPNVADNLKNFEKETWRAIRNKYSTNLVLHSFQDTYHRYGIEKTSVQSFFRSMEMDVAKQAYTAKELDTYIHGSAEVIGLMCFNIFSFGDQQNFSSQKRCAVLLGSAWQKVNFLRDLASDKDDRQRTYFSEKPALLTEQRKQAIVEEVREEMQAALEGVCRLPRHSRYGVLAAWKLYALLLKQIEKASVESLIQQRVSVSKWRKIYIWCFCYCKKMLRT